MHGHDARVLEAAKNARLSKQVLCGGMGADLV
jgi:hypothetical protein